jgi:hypothetical protein
MTLLVQLSWALLALIHAMPGLALFRPALLTQMYGVEAGGTTYLLLHHRAALFLGVFVLCAWSVFAAAPRPAAAVLTAISMLTFLLLYWQAGGPPALRTIAVADIVGLAPLAFVIWHVIRP